MRELHAKIDNQAFIFMHVVEQVQLFKMRAARSSHSYLWVRNRERGEGHCNELNNPDPPRRPGGATRLVCFCKKKKKKGRFSRLEVKEKAGLLCVCVSPCGIGGRIPFRWGGAGFRGCACERLDSEPRRHAQVHKHATTWSLILVFIVRFGVGEWA